MTNFRLSMLFFEKRKVANILLMSFKWVLATLLKGFQIIKGQVFCSCELKTGDEKNVIFHLKANNLRQNARTPQIK